MAAAAAAKAAETAPAASLHWSPAVTGIAFYAVSYALLNHWEERVLPKLQDKGIMPVLPGSLKDIQDKQKEIFDAPWATPLTADRSLPLPTLEQLFESPHRVSSRDGIIQWIRAHAQAEELPESTVAMTNLLMEASPQPIPIKARYEGDAWISDELGVCKLSPDFSEYYGHNVYICKRPDGDRLKLDVW